MRFSVCFEKNQNTNNRLFSYRNNDISGTHVKGFGACSPEEI